MTEVNSELFDFDGQSFEIKTFRIENGLKVMVFKDGKRVNNFSYSVTSDENFDFSKYNTGNGVAELISMAKSDIENGLIFGQSL